MYEYKKEDIEYALSLFPENFGFQYFFLKKIGRHLYYRALLNEKALGLEKEYQWMYITGGLLLYILLIIATYSVGKRTAKKKQQDEE